MCCYWDIVLRRSKAVLKDSLERYPAGRPIGDLLAGVIKGIQSAQSKKFSKMGKLWIELVGPQYAKMTVIEKFSNGILYVKVSSASLYSLLAVQEKPKLIRAIQEALPLLELTNIVFRR